MDQKALDAMNKRFAEDLGRNPHGQPRFLWTPSHDVGEEMVDRWEEQNVNGVVRNVPLYRFVPYSMLFGGENRWMVVRWKGPAEIARNRMDFDPDKYAHAKQILAQHPEAAASLLMQAAQFSEFEMTESIWNSIFQSEHPFPRHGQYVPVEQCWLTEGEEPTMDRTIFAIHFLRKQMAMTIRDRTSKVVDEMVAKAKADRDTAHDMVDNDWPAFDEVPGRKHGTAFQVPGLRPAVAHGAAKEQVL